MNLNTGMEMRCGASDVAAWVAQAWCLGDTGTGRQRMETWMTFADRVKAAGLTVTVEDLPKLEALVADLDRAAQQVRGPRPYDEEPLSAFRLRPVAAE